jgi:hypothetical protein
VPQDLDSLFARFLPGSAAEAVFVAANQRIYSSVQPELRSFSARIIRHLEQQQPASSGSVGEYRLLDLDGRQMLLVSSLLSQSQPVSLLFSIQTSFCDILNSFSALEKLLNAPELPDLSDLKARKTIQPEAQRWQDALFETQPESPQSPELSALPTAETPAPPSEGWTLIF